MSNATTDRVSQSEVPPRSATARILRLLLFGGTVVAGVTGGTSAIGGLSVRIVGALTAGLFLVASLLVAPVLVYADASRVRSLDLGWRPGPLRHAVGAFALTVVAGLAVELGRVPLHEAMRPLRSAYYGLASAPPQMHSMLLAMCAPLGALYYLARRREHLDGPTPSRYWWLVLPAVVAVGAGYLAAELLAPGSLPRVAAATMILASAFPIAAYLDASHVRASAADWSPNPAVQFLLAYLAVVVYPLSVLYPAYAAVYLARRRRAWS